MEAKLLSTLIGYAFGCLLTAEIVAHRIAGKSASALGETGNPGMANIMASLGFLPGLITLIGDLLKCAAAALIAYELFKEQGWIVTLYASLGCTIGHDFPIWRKFKGGKGVATSSIGIAIYAFIPGLIANIAGMLTVFATKYLCIGGPVIPLVFTVIMFIREDQEAGWIGVVLTALSAPAHSKSMSGIRDGRTSKIDVLGKLFKKQKPEM